MSTRSDLFIYVVNQLRYGAAQEELSDALNECVTRSQETGKVSELTVTIKIKPQGKGGQYFVIDDFKTKLPKTERAATILFGTPDGNLQREDPSQRKWDLRDVTAPTPAAAELRTVNG